MPTSTPASESDTATSDPNPGLLLNFIMRPCLVAQTPIAITKPKITKNDTTHATMEVSVPQAKADAHTKPIMPNWIGSHEQPWPLAVLPVDHGLEIFDITSILISDLHVPPPWYPARIAGHIDRLNPQSKAGSKLAPSSTCLVPETPHQMIIDHPRRLQQRVANGGTDEAEAAFLQFLAHAVG